MCELVIENCINYYYQGTINRHFLDEKLFYSSVRKCLKSHQLDRLLSIHTAINDQLRLSLAVV
jgi:hypothetical protein